jgi:hypothetical protein
MALLVHENGAGSRLLEAHGPLFAQLMDDACEAGRVLNRWAQAMKAAQ